MDDVTPCVDDEALFALARGELAGTALARAEAHLQYCADCRAVLAAATEPDGQRETARIARYEIAALLGAGAAGVVYRALDPQLRRPVALKLLRPELHSGSPEQSERLLREAQAMARLSDPHVVALYDVGLHEGRVYLVMEFVDGCTLREWLSAAPRSVSEVLEVFTDAALGLSAAHRKGLVHRDFKPENVLVGRDGRAKVTDFGLARESATWRDGWEPEAASTELYAPTRGLVGTPAYMAPELFEGGRATPQSDQFAFAVALYVALFERHPFRAGEGIALSELVTRARASRPETPSFSSATHERIFPVLRRSLSAVPEERFADLTSLLAALTAAQRRRHGGGWLALGVAALVVIAALVLRRAESPAPAVTSAATPPRAVLPPSAVLSAPPAPASAAASALPSARKALRRPAPDKPRPTASGEVRYKDWLKDPF